MRYYEADYIAEVKIISDNSNEFWEDYGLEVLNVIRESEICNFPTKGEVFFVTARKNYRHLVGWDLK